MYEKTDPEGEYLLAFVRGADQLTNSTNNTTVMAAVDSIRAAKRWGLRRNESGVNAMSFLREVAVPWL